MYDPITMKQITLSRGIIIPIKTLLFFVGCLWLSSANAQVSIAFQGAEPGDTWGYTTTGIGAAVASECASNPNIKTGTRSIGVGGMGGGGNCWLGGSGNGPNTVNRITFNSVNIATSAAYTRTLSFSWGNRFPSCSGTGWDSGENLTFIAYHNGVAQPQVTIVNGSNNAAYSIKSNTYTWTIPPCVQDFSFAVSITTNRNDELLFIDDVEIKAPALNPVISQPSAIAGNTVVCQGSTAVYSVTSVPGISYTWSNLPAGASFTSVNGSTNSYSIGLNWGTASPGTYTLLVNASDACGSGTATPQSLEVTVQPPPVPLSITGPTSLCQGNSITLTSNYVTGNTWSTGATTQSISVNAAGVYTLTALSTCGPLSTTHTVSTDPPANAAITANGPLSFCQGSSVVLSSATATGNTWSTGAVTPSITVTSSGTYSLNVTTPCGNNTSSVSVTVIPSSISPSITATGPTTFCQGASVILVSSEPTGNTWSTGATSSTITVNTAGIYTLTANNGCATASVTQSITVIPAPVATIIPSGPTTFCQGGSLTLSSGSATGNTWSTGATTPTIQVTTSGTYTLSLATTCGVSTAVQQVLVNPLPIATIQVLGSTAICPGASVQLQASGGTGYVWSTGQTTNSITVNSAGVYSVAVTNSCGTATSQAVTITSLPLPTAQIIGAGVICSGDSLQLNASGGSGYVWSNGSTAPSIYVRNSGTYSVISSNSCGTATASAQVTVTDASVQIGANVLTGNAPLDVQFNSTHSGNITAYAWNFGNGSLATGPTPAHTFSEPGVYTVTLAVQSSNGCIGIDTITIVVVSEASFLQIPNVFTPNNDQVNDYFSIKSEGLSEFQISIFDRWGKSVMESSDPLKAWDGKSSMGNEAADGTYFYVITAKGRDGKDYTKTGSVNLFR